MIIYLLKIFKMTKLFIFYGIFIISSGSALASQHRHGQLMKALSSLTEEDASSPVETRFLRRVDAKGTFLSYVNIESINSGYNKDNVKLRRRRSVTESLTPQTDDHEVFIEMDNMFDMPKPRFHLKKNYKLVSKNFQLEIRGRGGKIVTRHDEIDDCHYTGTIHNYDGYSKVALSLCDGMQGVIAKDGVEYVIEPLFNETSNAANDTDDSLVESTTSVPFSEAEAMSEERAEGHPHVIYKRSIFRHLHQRKKSKDDLGHCGYSDDTNGETPWWRVKPQGGESNTRQGERHGSDPSSSQNKGGSKKSRRNPRHHHHEKGITESNDLEEETLSRKRRSVSRERNVETLVVADKMMVGYHGRKDVESYILTIMNIVSNLYHDASIGNAVNIIVTRIVLLTEDQPDLKINHHADRSLDSFCRWQHSINVNDSQNAPESGIAHHDNAVLLTGYDICTFQNKPCGTLGLAPVSGMCEQGRSCNINEDIGLASAFTIAHEMGHNFGMEHDGNGNDCGMGSGEPAEIMAAQYSKNSRPFTWSRCSRSYITEFLDTGSGECLGDGPPRRDFQFPEELPGQQHSADEQCRFQYGPQSRQCNYGHTCQVLWCVSQNGRCITNSIPAAEGTKCFDTARNIAHGWCYQGRCEPYGQRPNSVDGGWGQWSEWSECSRTCGGGASSSYRQCNNPEPQNGGKYCIGQRRRYHTCNAQACNATSKSFREQQCAQFDAEPFQGKYYNWKPFVGGHNVNPCALNCLAEGYSFYTERAKAVVDGTRCFADSMDMCINGDCHHVGCDGVLHSEAVEDKCRVCGGDGSTCETVNGVFQSPGMQGLYEEIAMIPKGAVHIHISEVVVSQQNYLALRSRSGDNYLNGGYTIDWAQKFDAAGTTFTYGRDESDPEFLKALGPTTEDLVVLVLLQETNKGIRYEYNVPVEHPSSGDYDVQFLWSMGEWSECSATCAGGTRRRMVICQRATDGSQVQHSYCDQSTMPSEEIGNCNIEPCGPEWYIGEWQSCSATCGGGQRIRVVNCQRKISQSEDEVVANKFCPGETPISTESCNLDVCPPQWVARTWTQCNSKCGIGWKKREVVCMSSDGTESYPNGRCNLRHKPPSSTRCNAGHCPPPRWVYGRWSRCSAKCGYGRRTRRVSCRTHDRKRSNLCSHHSRPPSVKSCRSTCAARPTRTSAAAGEECADDPKFTHCALVLKFKFCQRPYFSKVCCQACSN